MDLLGEDTFRVMHLIWGYAVLGETDFSAQVAEMRWDKTDWSPDVFVREWDQTDKYLDRVELNGKKPPEWFSLWWVGEWKRRNEAP